MTGLNGANEQTSQTLLPNQHVDLPQGWSPAAMDAQMLLYAPGYPVEIGMGEDKFQAIVIAVAIHSHGAQYQVAWWNGRERKEAWLREYEIAPLDHGATKVKVGFVR